MKKNNLINTFIIIAIVLFFVTFYIVTINANAEEIDDYSNTDFEQDERLNNIEIRLEELGYKINETENAIVAINENEASEQEQRLSISEKMDLMLIAYSQQLDIEIGRNEQKIADDELIYLYRDKVLEHNKDELMKLEEISQETVSGNYIIAEFDNNVIEKMDSVSASSMEEFNKTLLSTNTLLSYLFVLILITLVILIAYGIGSIIKNITNKFVN